MIGNPRDPAGQPLLYFTWRGWTGGIVESPDRRLDGPGIVPAGILAAALGISETFQQPLGNPVPGRRDVGISLWRPDHDWRPRRRARSLSTSRRPSGCSASATSARPTRGHSACCRTPSPARSRSA